LVSIWNRDPCLHHFFLCCYHWFRWSWHFHLFLFFDSWILPAKLKLCLSSPLVSFRFSSGRCFSDFSSHVLETVAAGPGEDRAVGFWFRLIFIGPLWPSKGIYINYFTHYKKTFKFHESCKL
jgi:hypothetical protein